MTSLTYTYQANMSDGRIKSYHNKAALFKDGWPTKEVRDKQSRIMEIQQYITNKIITDRNYKPANNDEDQPLRDEMDRLRKELGIR